ncbi:MAG: ATP-binding protein [Bacteroidota bacterium]
MKNQSFRSIITVTLILVISSISFVAFHLYSNYLGRKIFANSAQNISSALVMVDLLKEQFYCSFEEHDGTILDTLLQGMENHDQVINASLYSADGELKYSLYEDSTQAVPVTRESLSSLTEGVAMQSVTEAASPFSRILVQMHNAPSCFQCHNQEQENLGYVVIDMTVCDMRNNTKFIQTSSLLFAFIMVAVILSFVLFIHYRFVHKSLREFNNTISTVNQGDLETRISIPETKELGRLGKNFNSMLDTFQKTQNELQEFHKKEMRSNYKMATIGEMSARLAHEIRNPLTGIANAIEIIVNETDDKQNIPILEEIQRQVKRVNDAISDILKYSRKKELSLELDDINEVVRKLVFFLENQVDHKEISFKLELQEEIPRFMFDKQQMEDVLLNLGLNSIQAIPRSGSITFATSFDPAEKRIHIFVTDTGKGINKEDLPSIFHPFFTTRNEGTGLGLAIVKDVIDKHKGEIWVENGNEGGCTFTISLPAEL